MTLKQELNKLNSLLAQAQKVLILLPSNSDSDKVAAGLGLYLGMLKQGKQATIASPSGVEEEDKVLTGANNIKTSLGGKDTVISLPYRDGEIETVTSYVEENKLNIVVKPQNGELAFTREDISVRTAGVEAELIFTVGVNDLSAIGSLYEQNKDSFSGKEIINLDNAAGNGNFGSVNIVNAKLPTVSEIVVLVLKNLKVAMDKDIATNLYQGLRAGTDNFNADKASALTFEAAALCLRSGAQRGQVTASPPKEEKPQPPPIPQTQTKQPIVQKPVQTWQKQPIQPKKSAVKQKPQNLQTISKKPTQPYQGTPLEETNKADGEDNNIPPEWLRPKIFTSNGNG